MEFFNKGDKNKVVAIKIRISYKKDTIKTYLPICIHKHHTMKHLYLLEY